MRGGICALCEVRVLCLWEMFVLVGVVVSEFVRDCFCGGERLRLEVCVEIFEFILGV